MLKIDTIFVLNLKIRQRIVQCCELDSPLQDSAEINESYLGAQCVRERSEWGAMAKQSFLMYSSVKEKFIQGLLQSNTTSHYYPEACRTEHPDSL
ncbi:hypothetical protein C8R34_12431 [Nitrosomonas sp. Nm84]|nr:hypothetical protein C8R34_12431 [Nitrosomonas sp. Nm84]